MKKLSVLVILCLSMNAYSQKLIQWIGGHPGQETKWECPANWDNNKLPDELSDVMISNQSSHGNFYPIVNSIVKINSLQLLDKTYLNIGPKAVIHIMNTKEYGFLNLGSINRMTGIYFDEVKVAQK